MHVVQEIGRLENELNDSALRTSRRWDEIRRGPMRDYVVEQLQAAPTVTELGPEWYPINPDHPFPGWRRDFPEEQVERLRHRTMPGGTRPVPVMVSEPQREVLIELRVGDLLDRDVVLVHPPLLADYLVAFERTHLVERLAGGCYLEQLRQYEGPGGQMFRRPFVYHGLNQGWSAGEIRVSFKL